MYQNSYFNNPYPMTRQELNRVNGMDSAKAFPTAPNSTVALFDSNDDVMYIKSTDASNFPTIRRFRFIEEPEVQNNNAQYVTVDEFNKFKEEVLNAQQFIQSANKWNVAEHATNTEHNENGKTK